MKMYKIQMLIIMMQNDCIYFVCEKYIPVDK